MSEYKIVYSEHFDPKSLKKFPKKDLLYIKKMIEEKLSKRPELFGKPLRKSLKGYRSLRVGDYRVIFRIDKRAIRIYAIENRSIVYEEVVKKIL